MNKQKLVLVLGAVVVLIGGFALAVSMYKGQRAEKLAEIVSRDAMVGVVVPQA